MAVSVWISLCVRDASESHPSAVTGMIMLQRHTIILFISKTIEPIYPETVFMVNPCLKE